jgi:hypothetical protein
MSFLDRIFGRKTEDLAPPQVSDESILIPSEQEELELSGELRVILNPNEALEREAFLRQRKGKYDFQLSGRRVKASLFSRKRCNGRPITFVRLQGMRPVPALALKKPLDPSRLQSGYKADVKEEYMTAWNMVHEIGCVLRTGLKAA